MSMLKAAANRQAFAKVGIYGDAGSGKTRTAAEIAIGLVKHYNLTKPVGMFDTEPAAGFIIPLFQKAGIEFLVYDESRALADLMAFMDEAEQACSVVIIDSITHVWRDAQESYLGKVNDGLKRRGKKPLQSLEFQHWRPIKGAWAGFTDRYLSSKVHAIVCGRAGAIYEYQTNETTGKKELINTGSRMATEKELGYEPSLLIEMVKRREAGRIVNTACIEKDRSDTLNGNEVPMPTFESFLSHFEAINIGSGEHFGSMQKRDSKAMFDEDGADEWSAEQRRRKVLSEEIEELLRKHFPSQSVDDKQKRAAMLERIFATRSWTKVSEGTQSDALKSGLDAMRSALEPQPVDA